MERGTRFVSLALVLACGSDPGSTGAGSTTDAPGSTGIGSTEVGPTTAGMSSSSSSSSSGSTSVDENTTSTSASSGTTESDASSSDDGDPGEPVGDCVRPWFTDDLEWSDVDEAIAAGPWASRDGNVSISENYAHSGSRSLRVAYGSVEAQSYLGIELPEGADHLFCRWWELRERAGDFPGAQDYDWGGEKFNRFRSAEIGVQPTGGLDYPLGWTAAGGFGQPGTQDGGEIGLFGNSVASNDSVFFGYTYAMPRGEWHAFELELRLGAPGGHDGETRLFIDGEMVAESTGLQLRPQTDATIDHIWIGGWYSNLGVDPDPAPAVRYVDDVTVCAEYIGP